MPRVLASLVAVLVLAAPAYGAFPQDPPNDPEFDRAQESCLTESVNDEQHYLFSFPSACAPAAEQPGGAAGMSVDKAWRETTAGRPDVTIAYIEGGINWHLPQSRDIVNQVYLNAGELPAATTPVDDGRLNVEDYGDSADANENGYVDAEDLIVRFSDGTDADRNGYVDDVSGWDFYTDQNDPSTLDDQYAHANNQMRRAAAEADNDLLGAGVCPRCTILPVKAGAEALDRSDDLAQAWLYAADAGASVIVSVTADLGYSSFMNQAVNRIWRRGVVMVEASNDFDSTDHQGGHFHEFVVPGNGMLTNTVGIPGPQANAATTSYIARSGKTSWGTKNFLTVSTQEGSTSQSTPIHGGVYALLAAAGRDAADAGTLSSRLTAAEILQVARATATDIDSPSTNWPSGPGFDLQYGYGRPDAAAATAAIAKGDVPPVGWIDSPEWYRLYDPRRRARVRVDGHVEARRSAGWSYELQMAPGPEPSDGDFVTVGRGRGTKPRDGRLGTVDLRKLPDGFAERAHALSETKTLETNERYTVTLRLRVTDATGRVGEDRRTIAVHSDPDWLPRFPRRIGPGGEAQPQLVDLQGRGRLAAVFGDSDGKLHAIDMRTARELPGWPRTTRPVRVTRRHKGIDPGHEPVVANAAVADLDGNGRLSAIFTSTSGRVYVFGPRGKPRKGWPRALSAGVAKPPIPRPRLPFTRIPVRGAFAPPVVADLDADGRLDVLQSGWNGRVHAWDARGRKLPGWPVFVDLQSEPPAGYIRIDDRKVNAPPVLAELDGDPQPEVVVRPQQADSRGADIQPLGRTFAFAYNHDGTIVPGWPAMIPSTILFYGSAQEFITEGSNVPAAADVDGDGRDEVAVSPLFSGTTLLRGDAAQAGFFGPTPDATFGAFANPAEALDGGLPGDAQVSFTTAGAFGRFGGGGLAYAEPGSGAASVAGALLLSGSGLPIDNTMRVFDAAGGAPAPGFPAESQGLNFLGGPTIADVTGDGAPEVLEGGDTSTLHAFGPQGAQAEGFPKFHTGWTLYAPTVADVDGDGRLEVVTTTREGYLMAWRTQGDAETGNAEWWSFRHDERNTSRYGTDTRPPSPVRRARLRGRTVRFAASGDDWRAGEAARYRIRAGRRKAVVVRSTRARVPRGAQRVTVQAVDDAGNRAPAVRVRVR